MLLGLVLGVLRVTLRALSRVVPQSRSVLVSGHPETEGNATEVARALLESYDGRVVWLREGGPVPAAVAELGRRGMVLVPKAGLRGLWAYLRAEAVVFTHGLYGSPAPVARKPLVNVWHGDGPKDVSPGVGGMIASTWFVGSTRLFSEHQAAGFGVPPERVLLTGNPRTDLLWRDVDPAALAGLGITGDFVLWMPTFRKARDVGALRAQSELRGGDDEPSTRHLDVLVEELGARGLQLVIKPHPFDAEDRSRPGALTLTDADLVAAGVPLYALLGRSRGLVTDYSSVWVDYLLTDRPMAFLVPDSERYTRRLVPPDVLDWLPGQRVGEEADFSRFLADLDADGAVGAAERAAVAARIGLNPTRTSARDLVLALQERGVLGRPRARRHDRAGTGARATGS